LQKNNYAALKIIDVGIFLFCFIKISFPVHFLYKWRQNLSARPRIVFSVLSTLYQSQVYSGWSKQTRRHMACLISRILSVKVNLHVSTDMALSSCR
jgi:hypothetical protein